MYWFVCRFTKEVLYEHHGVWEIIFKHSLIPLCCSQHNKINIIHLYKIIFFYNMMSKLAIMIDLQDLEKLDTLWDVNGNFSIQNFSIEICVWLYKKLTHTHKFQCWNFDLKNFHLHPIMYPNNFTGSCKSIIIANSNKNWAVKYALLRSVLLQN